MEASEGAQDENEDESGSGRERERGRRWRPVDEYIVGTGTGAGTETRALAEIGTEMRMGTEKGTMIGSRRAEKRRRSAINSTIVVVEAM